MRTNTHVEREELITFCRQFGVLMEAGTDLLRILAVLREQTNNNALKSIYASIERDVRMGRLLSTALGRFPDVFPQFFITMVRQGEMEEVLPQIFLKLADHLSRPIELEYMTLFEQNVDQQNLLADRLWPLLFWMSVSVAGMAVLVAILWYATSANLIPPAFLGPNVCLLVGVFMLGSSLVFARLRPRQFTACSFCGRPMNLTYFMKRSSTAAMCDRCIEQSFNALQAKRQAEEKPPAEEPAPSPQPAQPAKSEEEEEAEDEIQIVREEESYY